MKNKQLAGTEDRSHSFSFTVRYVACRWIAFVSNDELCSFDIFWNQEIVY